MRHRPNRPGYTMVEVITAFVLIAIAGGVVVPKLNWSRFEADAAARQLRYTLQTAQRLAVTQQSVVIVGIDSAGRRLRVVEDVNGDLLYTPGERLTWRPLEGQTQFATPPSPLPGRNAGGSMLGVTQTIDGYPSLVFRRDGSASATAVLYVRALRHAEYEYRGVEITQATGRVAWWRAAGTGASVHWAKATL